MTRRLIDDSSSDRNVKDAKEENEGKENEEDTKEENEGKEDEEEARRQMEEEAQEGQVNIGRCDRKGGGGAVSIE